MILEKSSDYFNSLAEITSAMVATIKCKLGVVVLHLSNLSFIILTSGLFQILPINVIFATDKFFYGEVKLKFPNGNLNLSLNGQHK
jgi:hypothetical protein